MKSFVLSIILLLFGTSAYLYADEGHHGSMNKSMRMKGTGMMGMDCNHSMMKNVKVKIKNIKNGAIITMTADKKEDIEMIQKKAEMMQKHHNKN